MLLHLGVVSVGCLAGLSAVAVLSPPLPTHPPMHTTVLQLEHDALAVFTNNKKICVFYNYLLLSLLLLFIQLHWEFRSSSSGVSNTHEIGYKDVSMTTRQQRRQWRRRHQTDVETVSRMHLQLHCSSANVGKAEPKWLNVKYLIAYISRWGSGGVWRSWRWITLTTALIFVWKLKLCFSKSYVLPVFFHRRSDSVYIKWIVTCRRLRNPAANMFEHEILVLRLDKKIRLLLGTLVGLKKSARSEIFLFRI